MRRPLVQEEEAGSEWRHHAFWHVTHFQVVHEPSEEQQESKNEENPPEPVLPIEVSSEVIWKSHNEDPFDKRESKAADGTISASNGVGQTERQAKPNPVE